MPIFKIATVSGLAMAWSVSMASAQSPLVIGMYGGSWGDAITACMIEPFTAKTGIQVRSDPGNTNVTFAKLQQQKGNPVIDVAWLGGGLSEMAAAQELIDPLDPARIEGIENMEERGVYHNKNGDIIALSTGFFSLGLVYNSNEIDEAPTSWFDMWNEKYSSLVTIPSSSNASGMTFFLHISKLLGGSVDDMSAAVEKFRQLEVASYYDSSGAANNNFSRSEAIIGAQDHAAAWSLVDGGLPIVYSVPKEGVPTQDVRVHIAAGTKNREAAEAFVNVAISKEASSCMAERLYVGPATKGVELSDKARERMPWGAEGSLMDATLVNWDEINEHREKLIELWNREVVRR